MYLFTEKSRSSPNTAGNSSHLKARDEFGIPKHLDIHNVQRSHLHIRLKLHQRCAHCSHVQHAQRVLEKSNCQQPSHPGIWIKEYSDQHYQRGQH